MNTTVKTVLLTILTLSVFSIAMIEISGISTTTLSSIWENISGSEQRKKDAQKAEFAKRDETVKNMPKTTIEIVEKIHDFGTITDGDVVKHVYQLKNTGTNPLYVANVTTSCGCTIPEYSKEPIAPGKIAEITLEFNSAGKKDKVEKNAMINANTEDSPFSVGFIAFVKSK